MCVKVSDMVLPPITGLCITFGTYMEVLGTMGRKFNAPFPPIFSHISLKIDCLGQFSKLCALRKRNMCVKVSDTVLPPITGLCITCGTYMEALASNQHYLWDIYKGFGHNGKIIQRTLPSHTQPSRSKLTVWASFRNLTHFGGETCA